METVNVDPKHINDSLPSVAHWDYETIYEYWHLNKKDMWQYANSSNPRFKGAALFKPDRAQARMVPSKVITHKRLSTDEVIGFLFHMKEVRVKIKSRIHMLHDTKRINVYNVEIL